MKHGKKYYGCLPKATPPSSIVLQPYDLGVCDPRPFWRLSHDMFKPFRGIPWISQQWFRDSQQPRHKLISI